MPSKTCNDKKYSNRLTLCNASNSKPTFSCERVLSCLLKLASKKKKVCLSVQEENLIGVLPEHRNELIYYSSRVGGETPEGGKRCASVFELNAEPSHQLRNDRPHGALSKSSRVSGATNHNMRRGVGW
jgi:hypothetical protein